MLISHIVDLEPLPFDAPMHEYQRQAEALLQCLRADYGDSGAQQAGPGLADAQVALARRYDFRDWAAVIAYAESVAQKDAPQYRFEGAVEAVINGDLVRLQELLRADPGLVRMRSARITQLDPPVHRATLLHYIAANGVENYRQRTPGNAVEVAEALLEAGSEPDALADMYGGQCTTMSMLVSSSHPATAGVQVPLVETLVRHGASVEAVGQGNWTSPLISALVFGFKDAAEALVRLGARVDNIVAAAGLGRVDEVRKLLPGADSEARHRALALAAPLGNTEVVRLLLDAGEDPNRYNPACFHAHTTPLHQAALNGHFDLVRLLVERGARLDIEDKIYHGTPCGWASHGGQSEIAEYLRAHRRE